MIVLKCVLILMMAVYLIDGIHAATCSNNYNFDYILFVVQWSGTFCSSNTCIQHQDKWSIHGAWPEYNNGSWPQDCCSDTTFNVNNLSSIINELSVKWLSLTSGGSEAFWQHEWEKHGTCAKNTQLLNNQLNYFKNTLHVFDTLGIEKSLTDAKIAPSDSHVYSVTEIHNAIENKVGKKVQLSCIKQTPYPLLSEIHICLDKNTLNPIACGIADSACGTGSVQYSPSKKYLLF